jgi:precorrin-6B methylase 2
MTHFKQNISFGFIANGRRFLSCSIFTLLEILAVRIPLFDSLLTRWRDTIITSEIQLLQIESSDRVLHLGCGAFPSAAIAIATKKKTHVVGIDNNSIAVKLARRCIKKKGLSCLVTIEHGDGVSYKVSDFDVIYVAINVWPIDRVLLHLAQTMKPTAQILCKGTHRDVISVLKQKEIDSLLLIRQTLDYPKMQSFLLLRK